MNGRPLACCLCCQYPEAYRCVQYLEGNAFSRVCNLKFMVLVNVRLNKSLIICFFTLIQISSIIESALLDHFIHRRLFLAGGERTQPVS